MVSMRGIQIGVIGAGAIGSVVIDRLIAGVDVPSSDIIAIETNEARRKEIAERYRVRITADSKDAASAGLLILCIPPLEVSKTLNNIGQLLKHRPLVVSFAAAVPLHFIESQLPGVPIIRVNPNSPSIVGDGFNPVTYGSAAKGPARALAEKFLAVLGNSLEISDEQMNLYTALTAVGPTYFLPVLDAMISSALSGGLTREAAVQAASETARGAAMMVAKRAEDPERLKLYTGLRPLRDAEVRDLVKSAIADALSRVADVQKKVMS